MLDKAPIYEVPASALTSPPQGTPRNPKKLMIEEPSYFIFNVAMSAAWGTTPPNVFMGGCRGDKNYPQPGTFEYNITNNICDSFPMYMAVDYIRVWQDRKTMSYGCDPASHPTKEFIKAHITEYTNALNPDIAVAGGATCNSNDDCTADGSVTGRCVHLRCQCVGLWTGPRCTRYNRNAVSYGPSIGVAGGIFAAILIAWFAGAIWQLRRKRSLQRHGEVQMRQEKSNSNTIVVY
ncbi:hypothetical protein SDRG_15522 [Saprolegnia diclina VS20]|uniref:EGF-like domain-containing protein n=1 Tax=Saprolegnia diclina (strain VS20) TaxID=1156394 RepID=T0PMP2_SAPDV|nr:hypothetical protein SDRG_15522 [Saprolegnia diclina VS20]EQC26684.1 hypothetical protein SDRG_15522 [Saprolegnia diclina VS20]|eukprot:XP_008619919.1 hypothetical protein SDRG_15522 [Saprolegnia diclina VS20]